MAPAIRSGCSASTHRPLACTRMRHRYATSRPYSRTARRPQSSNRPARSWHARPKRAVLPARRVRCSQPRGPQPCGTWKLPGPSAWPRTPRRHCRPPIWQRMIEVAQWPRRRRCPCLVVRPPSWPAHVHLDLSARNVPRLIDAGEQGALTGEADSRARNRAMSASAASAKCPRRCCTDGGVRAEVGDRHEQAVGRERDTRGSAADAGCARSPAAA